MKSIINIKGYFYAFHELVSLLTRHRQLTFEMAKREFTDRYLGQVFGTIWAVGHPLVLMAVYIFLFVVVFKVKIGGTRELPLDFTTYLLSGLIPWLAFQESMGKGCIVITSNSNLVKQIIFPIEILPVKGVLVSIVTMSITSFILIVYVLFTNHSLHWTYILLPLLIFFQTLAMIGVAYIISSVGVYFRDVKDFVQIFSFAGLFMIPVFYLPHQVPGMFKLLLYINPFSYLIWCYQDVLYFGRFEHWWAWVVFITLSIGVFIIGFRIFRKLKYMFGEML